MCIKSSSLDKKFFAYFNVLSNSPLFVNAHVANIQTLNNLDSNIPNKPLSPWGTAVIKNSGGNFDLSIEMSETNDGVFTEDETIAYMAAEGNIVGEFVDNSGNTIKWETIKTDNYFVGWSDSCKKVSFQNSYENNPIIAGWKDTRN